MPQPTAATGKFTFDDVLRSRLTANLSRHERLALAPSGARRAAVAVVVLDSDARIHGADNHQGSVLAAGSIPGPDAASFTGGVAGTAGGPAIVLTRRATTLRSHGGQWALPGGRLDDGETALQAVRRELH
nr:NUDIX domain-containing protein [Actinomycetota bacterium]